MKHSLLITTVLGIGILYVLSACADKLPPPTTSLDCSTITITYNGHVKRILDAQCATVGCHDNNTQTAFGAYNTLDTLRMSNIYNRVCVLGDMPPSGTTTAIIDTIRCWKEKGYLEN